MAKKSAQDGQEARKLGPSGHLGRVLGRLGSVLDRLGRILGDKLGPSGRLGRVLGPSWAVLDAIFGAKMEPKTHQKNDQKN